ncbi:MAG TPA: hypothetical protein GX708_24710 [Gallicola sp.]|nr:hypothetical protein [Gallicola sp.]
MINFQEQKLPNNSYRYTCIFHSINICIDSDNKRTEEEIEDFLYSRSIKWLIDNEGYIINL